MKTALIVLAVLIALGSLLWLFGPREPVDLAARLDGPLPDDLDAHLEAAEAEVANLRPNAAKEIVWADPEARAPTPLSIVYIHGFSAAKGEVRPVPDRLAEALGANLFFTRLTGHGRDGAAMAEPDVGDWMRDVDEALRIGRRIGERVVVVSTSTGGTLTLLALDQPDMADGIAGAAFISPNFEVQRAGSSLLTWPFAAWFMPLVVGDEASSPPRNEGHAANWTLTYPSAAFLPMGAAVRAAKAVPVGEIEVPAMFVYSPEDQVVSPTATEAVAMGWAGPVQTMTVTVGEDDDPSSHVIAGDLMSPGQTDRVADALIAWAEGL